MFTHVVVVVFVGYLISTHLWLPPISRSEVVLLSLFPEKLIDQRRYAEGALLLDQYATVRPVRCWTSTLR